MSIRKRNIKRHELIGLPVKITESRNSTLVGLQGEVVDETKNTLKIRTGKEVRQVLKNICTFDFNGILVHGNEIVGRPENRLKKVKK